MPVFMSNPLFWESSQNAHFDTHHLHSQPEEVCNAKMASDRAPKTYPQTNPVSHSMSPTYSNHVHQALVTPKLSNKAWVRAGLALGWFVSFSLLWKTCHSHMHSRALHAIVPVTLVQLRKAAESPGETRGCWEKPL